MTQNINENTRPDAVIFDCDGILVDTEPMHYAAFQEVLVPLGLGHNYDTYLEQFIGFDDRDAFIHAFKSSGREISADELDRLIKAKAASLDAAIERGVKTFPGVVELVRELKSRAIPLAVASGALRHEVIAFVRSLGIDDAFSAIVAADDVSKSKPDPETYLAAIDLLKKMIPLPSLNPGKCFAIEDTRAGIASAKAAGLKVVGVTNSFPASELGQADHIVGSLADLPFSEISLLLARLGSVKS